MLQGSICDVAVDVRQGSPTFKQWVGIELRADCHQMFWVPPGFAHGLLALEESQVTEFYKPSAERSIHWASPALNKHLVAKYWQTLFKL